MLFGIMLLVLTLPRSLIEVDIDRQRLPAAAIAHAANRRGAETIKADRHARMRIGCADAVDHVEGDPAEIGNESFSPGVAGVGRGSIIAAEEIIGIGRVGNRR
jgi:hypothetical protein